MLGGGGGLVVYGYWWLVAEGSVLFNDALNTLYLWLYGVDFVVKEKRKPTAATWATLRVAARGILHVPSHIQDDFWYTSRGVLAGTKNRLMGPPY